MQITLSPVRIDTQLTVVRSGDTLTLNGEAFDFSDLPDGATLPRHAIDSKWFAGDVMRIDGDLHIMLVLPHGPNAPEATCFPQPITLTKNGTVDMPPYNTLHDAPEEEA